MRVLDWGSIAAADAATILRGDGLHLTERGSRRVGIHRRRSDGQGADGTGEVPEHRRSTTMPVPASTAATRRRRDQSATDADDGEATADRNDDVAGGGGSPTTTPPRRSPPTHRRRPRSRRRRLQPTDARHRATTSAADESAAAGPAGHLTAPSRSAREDGRMKYDDSVARLYRSARCASAR